MAYCTTRDGTKLYYEKVGAGAPVVFVHEYAGLLVLPRADHTITSEEPAAFNAAIAELFAAAESGRWMAHRAARGHDNRSAD